MTNPQIEGGYILIARRLAYNEIMGKPPLYLNLWVWMLMQANYRDKDGLKRGQFFTSVKTMQNAMSYKVGYRAILPTKKQIKDVLRFLRAQPQHLDFSELKQTKPKATDDNLDKYTSEGTNEGTNEGTMIETTKVPGGLIITICNYDYYQDFKNYEGTSISRTKVPTKVPTKVKTENDTYYLKKERNKKNLVVSPPSQNDKKTSITDLKIAKCKKHILEKWNSLNIIVHGKINEKHDRQITTAIKNAFAEEHEIEDIVEAIQNYDTVLKGSEFYFSYKWPLWDFMTRGLEKFYSEVNPFLNFTKDSTERDRQKTMDALDKWAAKKAKEEEENGAS